LGTFLEFSNISAVGTNIPDVDLPKAARKAPISDRGLPFGKIKALDEPNTGFI
jgi:hypothetical protein